MGLVWLHPLPAAALSFTSLAIGVLTAVVYCALVMCLASSIAAMSVIR